MPDEISHWLTQVQFIPALNASLAGVVWPSLIILGGLILATLIFGRVYCSFICPLGIFQDVVSRIGKVFRGKKSKFLRYAPPIKWVRYIILGIIALAFLVGAQAYFISWLDPYSQFGRLVNMFLSPSIIEANNALSGYISSLYVVDPLWPEEVGILVLPVTILLLVVIVMALLKGRLYCNSICPVGSLLGLLSRFSAFRITFDKSACTKCASCMKICKSQCIDLKKSEIDYSRCVNCFDCTDVCNQTGLQYRFTWWGKGKELLNTPLPPKKKKAPTPPSAPVHAESDKPSLNPMGELPESSRRAFMGLSLMGIWATITGCKPQSDEAKTLYQRSHAVSKAITPPGSGGFDRFLDYCTACHLCLDVCPSKTLRPAYMEYGAKGFLKPHLTFEKGFCEFECNSCSEVCPTGAILPLSLPLKKKTRIGLARFTATECIVAADKYSCGACSEHCPTQALAMVPIQEVIQVPKWNADYCARCGECFKACQYGAITQVPDPDMPDAKKPIFNSDKCTGCGKCRPVCEAGAITYKPAEYNLTIPKLTEAFCIGCGACEFACPVKAVVVAAVPEQKEVEVKQEEKVVDPNAGADFAF